MGGIIKLVFAAAPVAALVIFLVLGKQEQHRTDLQIEQTKFERDMAEFNAEFQRRSIQTNLDAAERYDKRAAKAEQELLALRELREEQDTKQSRIMDDFEQAIQEIEAQLGGDVPNAGGSHEK